MVDKAGLRSAALVLVLVTLAVAVIATGCGETGGRNTETGTEASAAPPGSTNSPPSSGSGPNKPAVPSKPAAPPANSGLLGRRTRSSGCRVHGELPDPACTPGAIFTQATVRQICTPGYSESVRNVPDALKRGIYAEYGIEAHRPRSYEVDHLVPLELGGNNSAANLWPEITPGYHEKDAIENRLHDAVCARSVSLRSAQLQIARDWRHTVAGAPSGPGVSPRESAPSTTRPAPSTSTGDFCTTHRCIPSFNEGHGTIVQCADGMWSHSGGEPGACSRHGGVR